MLRTVDITRYITPLREGSSLPALVEADDGREYVIKFRGAGHEGKPDVEAHRPPQQVADLVVRLGAGNLLRQRRQHDLRHRKAQGAPDLPHDELGDQRLLAVAGAAELDDVLAAVVGLHQCRQRAALPQRRDVPGDVDRAEHAGECSAGAVRRT